jgi:NAD(P)-dependent dehydrogenase (short-subunit alcohol dehydrogenase family)
VSGAEEPSTAVVVGAGGGLGAAFVDLLERDPRYGRVLALSRRPAGSRPPHVVPGTLELTDEPSIAEAAATARELGSVRLVLVATGLLHDPTLQPEKSWGALDGATLARAFATNAIGPALVAKHFLPLLPREGRSVFAALSARVGSIGDNRLGGWYAYRSSKAALNMLLKTFAIELARRAPAALCVGLHPGTVATRLSEPFRRNVAPDKLFTPAYSAGRLLTVLDALRPEDSGGVFAWDGSRVPE